MTKTISTLAALFLATSALTSAAEAGGVRLSFGGPLGNFTAHEKLSDGPAGTARYSRAAKPHCAKPNYAARARSYTVARHHEDAPARKVVRKAPKVEVAEAPVHKTPRKPKVYIEHNNDKPAVKTAKLEDKAVVSDAAPSITVPQSPATQAQVSGTQSTPAVDTASTQTASLEQAPLTAPAVAPDAELKTTTAATEPAPAEPAKAEPVKVEPAQTEAKAEKPVKDAKAKSDSMAARICKRFSAAIAGLVDVPCE